MKKAVYNLDCRIMMIKVVQGDSLLLRILADDIV